MRYTFRTKHCRDEEVSRFFTCLVHVFHLLASRVSFSPFLFHLCPSRPPLKKEKKEKKKSAEDLIWPFPSGKQHAIYIAEGSFVCIVVHAFQLKVPLSLFGILCLKKRNFVICDLCSHHYISFFDPRPLDFVFSSLFTSPPRHRPFKQISWIVNFFTAEAREDLLRIAWKCSLSTIFSAFNAASYYLTSFLWDKGVPEQDE